MDLSSINFNSESGMDAVLNKSASASSGRVRVASLKVLASFERVSQDTLIHRSSKDLWSLAKDDSGYFIERLFDTSGGPLKV